MSLTYESSSEIYRKEEIIHITERTNKSCIFIKSLPPNDQTCSTPYYKPVMFILGAIFIEAHNANPPRWCPQQNKWYLNFYIFFVSSYKENKTASKLQISVTIKILINSACIFRICLYWVEGITICLWSISEVKESSMGINT